MEIHIIIIRLAIVFILSIVYGLYRQHLHKPIGFGTFIFVAMGSCALAIAGETITPEPLPLLSAIVTGIGFLGAGALLKTSDKVFGFTSAATIWLFAIFGLIIGIGQYFIGIILYSVVWAIILVDMHFEEKSMGIYQKRLVITTNKIMKESDIKKIMAIHTTKYEMVQSEINKQQKKMILTYLVQGEKKDLNAIPLKLYEQEWLEDCKVEG